MRGFNFHVELEGPEPLPAAVAALTGEADVRLLRGWQGCEKDSLEICDEDTGAVNIEWYRREGRFALDVHVFGPGLPERETTARFARALSARLGRALLFSDCSAFPFSYFMAEPDGAIQYVVVATEDDAPMDLHAQVPPEPFLTAGAVLPLRPDGASLARARKATCDFAKAGAICEPFWSAGCPKGEPLARIVVLGGSGSGKSTLARTLGARLGSPVIHLDALYYGPGWRAPAPAAFAARADAAHRGLRWVSDGNFVDAAGALRLRSAGTVVFLDLPLWRRAANALRRRFTRASGARPDLAPGCAERIDGALIADIWSFARAGKPKIEAALARLAPETRVVRLHSAREIAAFVESISPKDGPSGATTG